MGTREEMKGKKRAGERERKEGVRISSSFFSPLPSELELLAKNEERDEKEGGGIWLKFMTITMKSEKNEITCEKGERKKHSIREKRNLEDGKEEH